MTVDDVICPSNRSLSPQISENAANWDDRDWAERFRASDNTRVRFSFGRSVERRTAQFGKAAHTRERIRHENKNRFQCARPIDRWTLRCSGRHGCIRASVLKSIRRRTELVLSDVWRMRRRAAELRGRRILVLVAQSRTGKTGRDGLVQPLLHSLPRCRWAWSLGHSGSAELCESAMAGLAVGRRVGTRNSGRTRSRHACLAGRVEFRGSLGHRPLCPYVCARHRNVATGLRNSASGAPRSAAGSAG
jgi:hypothetical protein